MRTALLLLARLVCAVRGHKWLVTRTAPDIQARDRVCSRCLARRRKIPLKPESPTIKRLRLRNANITYFGVKLNKRGWAEIALRPKKDVVGEMLRRMGMR